MLNRNKKVIPLEEGFEELGLDAKKMLGSMERNTALVEARSAGTPRSAGPPISTYGDPSHVTDQALLENTDLDLPDGHNLSPEELEEYRAVRKKTGTAAKRARKAAKRARKKKKGKLRAAGKKYRKTAAGKKARKKHARLLKRIGGPKKGKRIFTADADQTGLEGLREDLNTGSFGDALAEDMGQLEEVALNASLVCAMLSDIFEGMGDEQSSQTMSEISESGTSLSDDLAGVESEEDMTEEQSQALEELVGSTVKALKLWEGIGGPSIDEAIDHAASESLSE